MDVFDLRERLVRDYASYVRSFINIRDKRIGETVERKLREGALWPDPLIQLNPAFEPGAPIPDVVSRNLIHEECRKVFAIKSEPAGEPAQPLRLYRHQLDAVEAARTGDSYALTTATGSTLTQLIDHRLRRTCGAKIAGSRSALWPFCGEAP